jgi:hypothetical protein
VLAALSRDNMWSVHVTAGAAALVSHGTGADTGTPDRHSLASALSRYGGLVAPYQWLCVMTGWQHPRRWNFHERNRLDRCGDVRRV